MHENATFWLKPVAPFRLDLTAWAVRRRLHNVIDRWDGRVYRRALAIDRAAMEVTVTQVGPPNSPRLHVTLTGRAIKSNTKLIVTRSLEHLLGLRINLAPFHRRAADDAKLNLLVRRFRGLKPSRFPTLFETLANAITCQQLSLSAGIHLLNRLTKKFGPAVRTESGITHAFPGPADLVNLRAAAFRPLGFSRQKTSSLIALACACVEKQVDLQKLNHLGDDAVVEKLTHFKGIGRWRAEYALLRGLGRLNIYPGDDVGARNNLRQWLKLKRPLDYNGVRRVTARWQPYAGLVYFYMLLDHLEAAGCLA